MNMTIKTQAYLQGYLHEKTAEKKKPWVTPLKTAEKKPWVTPLVEAPGIPQTAPDPGAKTLFPDGKATHKATQLQMPETSRERLIREGQAEAKRHRDAGTTPKQQEWNEGFRRRRDSVLDWMPFRAAPDPSLREVKSFIPGSMSDQLLQNLKDPEGNPVSAAEFVAIQKAKFENDLGAVVHWSKVLPRSDLIDYEKRDQPVTLDTFPTRIGPHTDLAERRIFGIDPKKVRENPQGRRIPSEYAKRSYLQSPDTRRASLVYHGYPEEQRIPRKVQAKPTFLDRVQARLLGVPLDPAAIAIVKKKDPDVGSIVDVLGHEGTHNYVGGNTLGDRDSSGEIQYFEPGTSYITDFGAEYTQGVTSGLNAMRDVTGQFLNTPQQVHQLVDEIVADPAILNHISVEHARVFRTYLNLRKTNPKLAEKLRDSMARDSQYLVENERVEDPMVQKA